MRKSGRLLEFSVTAHLAGDDRPETVARLIRQSWSEHVRSGVTGVLKVAGARIEQTLEGPSQIVLPLATQILTDRRYGWLRIDAFGPIAERRHADWSVVGFLPPAVARSEERAGLRVVDFGRLDAPDTLPDPGEPAAIAAF